MSKISKKIIYLIISIMLILFLSSCSSDSSSGSLNCNDTSTNLNSNETSHNDDTIYGEIINDDFITTETTTEVSLTPITDNPFVESFQSEKQRIERIYTAPETGVYRFDFTLDNANSAISIYIENEQKTLIKNDNNIMNNEGFNVTLEKGHEYHITLKAVSGCPELTMTIGIPHHTITLFNNNYNDKISYTGQQNTYEYTAPRDGIYRFDVVPSYVTFHCRLKITAPDKSILKNTYLEGRDGVTVSLKANTCYSISLTQETDFSAYSINIGIPDETRIAPQRIIIETIDYTDDVDKYILYVPTTGKYKFIFDISDVTKRYEYEIYDEKNKRISYDSNVTQETHIITLEAGKQYELHVLQNYGLCEYQIEYFPYVEN